MKRLVVSACVLSLLFTACGDNLPAGPVDAMPDMQSVDMMGDIDMMPDAPPTPAERIELARALPDGVVSFGIVDATITYIKPVIAGATANNDPGGFTIQVEPTGPALMIEADVTMLTPAPAVGDVVSFTIGEMKTAGSNGTGLMRRGAAITNYTRSMAATDIAPLVQDVTAIADLASMVADFESELIEVTNATIAEGWGNSGNAFQRTRITTTGVTAVDPNLQLRIPTAFRDSLQNDFELVVGCVVSIHRTPVNRFAAQFQVSAFDMTDLTITSCPAPTVVSATATDSTHVTVTFSRNIDPASVMANGSQFTIVDDATPTPNALEVTAAAVTGARTISLTTATQGSGTNYTVTVANTVEDFVGDGVGTPNTATFTGFVIPIPTVTMATATNATTVTVTFSRNIDMTSVMANGSQFTIVDDATPTPNTLAVTAASVSGMVVTLTTDAQTPGANYTVTVANTVTDTDGTPVGTPNTATFTGFSTPIPTVMMATASNATTVTVTFTRNIDMASVMADGSQFAIADDATPTPNVLAVTAASVSGMVVTLTTDAQTPGTMYTVTVASTVTDTDGTAIGTPNTATFLGFTTPIPSVMMAAATNATTVDVTFTRPIDMATVMADGSQFTIADDATPTPNTLTVTAASVSGMVVTLTTDAQTPGTMYTVTVDTTVEDTDGTPVGAPLSATFLGFTPSAGVDHLVINEVDYNQAGSPDPASFIEIYNPTAAAIALADLSITQLNGGSPGGPTAPEYGSRVALSGAGAMLPAGAYLVIRNATVTVPVGTMTIDVTGDFLQNGPDGIALINTATNTLVDALHYGGGAGITMGTIAGFPSTVSVVEGTAFTGTDPNDDTSSLARFPNGADTNNASVDWAVRAPTPGATN